MSPNELLPQPIIGLEIHVQLATRTKLFCACPLDSSAAPNTHICPICFGLPGALPRLNQHAVELAVRAALALSCQIATNPRWDRKQYSYPDLPKGYQISQYELPLARDGLFEFPCDGGYCRIPIQRVHLEDDAGKNTHDLTEGTGVDLNRAGTPLIEIVTAPAFHSAAQVRTFAIELHRLVRYLSISVGNMQQGHMRFEPNINVNVATPDGPRPTPIVEVKNLNSFRALHDAIDHEIGRQIEAFTIDGTVAGPGNKRNRGWDELRRVTVPQRTKEEPDDYRYFPDPDVPPVTCPTSWIDEIRECLPELPAARAQRVAHAYRVGERDAATLIEDRATADLLDDAAEAGGDPVTLGKQFLGLWTHLAHQRGTTIAGLRIAPGRLAELANLVTRDRLNATAAARVAAALLETHAATPAAIAERLGLLQVQDETVLAEWVRATLRDEPEATHDARTNAKRSAACIGYLVGCVMKRSNGRADPKRTRALVQTLVAQTDLDDI